MRKIGKRTIALMMAVAVAASSMTGCTKRLPSDVIASYGDQMIGRSEAEFYARYQQYSTEYMYLMYGSDPTGLWKQTDSTTSKTYEDQAKESALTAVLQTEILNEKAVADGITLTEEEQKKIEEAAEQIMKAEPVVEASGVTEEIVKSIVTKNAMANKQYQAMIADIDTNVDESTVLHKTIEQISIRVKQDETAASTESTEQTEEQKEQAQKEEAALAELASIIQSALEQGATLDEIVENYHDKEFNGVTFTVEKKDAFAIGKDDTAVYTEQAMAMTKGQVITAVDTNATYVVRCTSEKDEEATQQAIEQELNNRRAAMFEQKYEELKKSAKKFTVNEKEWEKVVFSEPLIEIPTSSADAASDVAASSDEAQAESSSTDSSEAQSEASDSVEVNK